MSEETGGGTDKGLMPQLPEIVQALLETKAYPETPPKVEMVQTQMSFVFFAGDYVYKIKKPVNLGYLDYTTLEKRKFFCEQEIELNRRLCIGTYIGVVPVTRDKSGNLSLKEEGEIIEYAVRMRRLPQDAMMDVLLGKNQVSPEMVKRIAEKLVKFHQSTKTSAKITIFGTLGTIRQNTEENFTQTEKYIGSTVTQEQFRRIKEYTDNFVKKYASLFDKRVMEGRIRDCHGDLHAAHICITDDICIYDCIEFNDRFRYCDVASEVAFLAMDMDHYGRADLTHLFVNSYVEMSGDKELKELLNFYKCYRAYVRAKVNSFKVDDPHISETERQETLEIARSYFDLAEFYTISKPILVITTGFVGTGKTALAQALAKRLGLAVTSSDVVRKQLASIPLTQHRFEKFDSGIYSADFTRKTYDTMFSEAKNVLNEGGSVILDASFMKAEERLKAKELAGETGADFFIIECRIDEESIKQRLAQRLKEGSPSDGRWEIYEPQKKRFEPVTEVPPANHIVVDTSENADRLVNQIKAKILK